MHHLVVIWFNFVEHWGYLGIVVLMALESSIVPVPSEVVIPPAAFLALQGQMSLWGVIAAGTLGSWIGSVVTYWISLWLGRVVIVRWGRYFLIGEAKLERAERFVHRYEAGGVFFARLLPVIRHLISIPAGLIRMRFRTFSAITLAGSFAWCSILAWYGAHLSQNHPDLIHDPAALVHAIKTESLPLVAGIATLCFLYLLVLWLTRDRSLSTDEPAA